MKGILQAAIFTITIVILGIFIEGVRGCNSNAVTACANGYKTCIDGITNLSLVCSCYGVYGECLVTADCFTSNDSNSFYASCEAAGCTAKECSSSSSLFSSSSFFFSLIVSSSLLFFFGFVNSN